MTTTSGSSFAINEPYRYRPGPGASVRNGTLSLSNTWSLTSFSHGKYPYSDPVRDRGGVFELNKTTHMVQPARVNDVDNGYAYMFQGPVIPAGFVLYGSGWYTGFPANSSDAQLYAAGTTAIARTVPTKPAFSLATSVGELMRDGLPAVVGTTILKDRARSLRKYAGSEYLNVEFGWKPLISDLRNFAKTVKQSNKIVNQYRKNSDSHLRRRYAFPTIHNSRTLKAYDSGVGYMTFTPIDKAYPVQGTGYMYSSQQTERWFSGAFRYHVPVGPTYLDKMRTWESQANQLLGLRLTPEVVWNLAPWSWAVDWFTNTGDIMTNITAMGTDGLVMHYGYIMEQTDKSASIMGSFVNRSIKHECAHHQMTTRKVRLPANPFGFGSSFDALTTRQTAILAALGLTLSGKRAR